MPKRGAVSVQKEEQAADSSAVDEESIEDKAGPIHSTGTRFTVPSDDHAKTGMIPIRRGVAGDCP